MHKHGKKTALILLAAVILTLFTGCGGNAAAETETEIPADTDGSVSADGSGLPDEGTLPERFRYTFRPHVLSEGYAEIYGESFREEYFAFCDAVLSGSSSFPVQFPGALLPVSVRIQLLLPARGSGGGQGQIFRGAGRLYASLSV